MLVAKLIYIFPTWRNHPPASLARTVPSLARSVPSLARAVLKPSGVQPRVTRRPRQTLKCHGAAA